ncbi:hypothetical protein V8E36_003543 [Tilletia maclaganii]
MSRAEEGKRSGHCNFVSPPVSHYHRERFNIPSPSFCPRPPSARSKSISIELGAADLPPPPLLQPSFSFWPSLLILCSQVSQADDTSTANPPVKSEYDCLPFLHFSTRLVRRLLLLASAMSSAIRHRLCSCTDSNLFLPSQLENHWCSAPRSGQPDVVVRTRSRVDQGHHHSQRRRRVRPTKEDQDPAAQRCRRRFHPFPGLVNEDIVPTTSASGRSVTSGQNARTSGPSPSRSTQALQANRARGLADS